MKAVLMVTKTGKPSAEECRDCPVERVQSSEIKKEVHHTGIHKYAQFNICGVSSLSVHRISLTC